MEVLELAEYVLVEQSESPKRQVIYECKKMGKSGIWELGIMTIMMSHAQPIVWATA